MSSQSVHIQWTFAELGEYISNTSAYVAKTLAQGAEGKVFDTFTITEDEHKTFLNDKLEEALLAVTPLFNRITPDESTPILPTAEAANVGISFVPRIEGGEYSRTDFAFVESLTKRYIASYILFEWYSIKGIAAMMQYFDGQRENAGKNLRDRLFRFVRPSRKSGITIRRVYGTRSDKATTTKVNNRSDFVLVWGPSDGSPLPDFNYDIVFYTEDGGLQYTVQTDSEYYKPIVGVDGVVRQAKIIFDLKGEYFPNGVLKYEMSGNVPDADFPEGVRYFEQVGETNVEIWDGATDANKSLEAAYLPAFVNVRFEDLTDEEIATIQAPALEAAKAANSAAAKVKEAEEEFARFAESAEVEEQTRAANEGTRKNNETNRLNAEANRNSEESKRVQAESKRVSAESARVQAEADRKQRVDTAISNAQVVTDSANAAATNANNAAEEASTAREDVDKAIANLEGGTYPQMSVGFAENLVGDGQATSEEFSYRATAGEDRNVADSQYKYDQNSNGGARIEILKGNSVVWNQLFDKHTSDRSYDDNGVHIVDNLDGSFTIWTDEGGATARVTRNLSVTHDFSYKGNKLVISGCEGAKIGFGFWDAFSNTIGTNYSNNIIITASGNGQVAFSVVIDSGAIVTRTTWNPKVYDLTQMFGANNEPNTIEEFYSRIPVGLDLMAYNKGEIVDGRYKSIKTTFFNQWDEQWEVGAYDTSTGDKKSVNNQIRNKNAIKVLPNTPYYGRFTSGINILLQVFFYDFNDTFIKSQYVNNVKFTTPENCAYINFNMSTIYGVTYKNDICINLAWNEYSKMNGTYQPYEAFVRDFSWLSDYFDNGIMRKCGDVVDELRYNFEKNKWEAITRVARVKMKDLSWSSPTSTLMALGLFNAKIADMRPYVSPENETTYRKTILCNAYPVASITSLSESMTDMSIMRHGAAYGVVVRNSTYTSISDFVASLTDNDYINYELAEPHIIEIDTIPSMDYDTADYGTEELIAYEGEQSAPMSAEIVYEPNALAAIKQIPDILKRLAVLEAKMASEVTINIE